MRKASECAQTQTQPTVRYRPRVLRELAFLVDLLRTFSMSSALKIIGLVCVILTVLLWIVTLTTDTTPGSIGAAACLTAIVAFVGILSLWS
jgi:hypothetical protein